MSLVLQEFGEQIRKVPLPRSLAENAERLDRFKLAVLTCVESLYRDRLVPTVKEVNSRLRNSGWPGSEAKAALILCAAEPTRYVFLPPADGQQPQIHFRTPPAWFQGWVDVHGASSSWNDFAAALRSHGFMKELRTAARCAGGVGQLLQGGVRQSDLPPCLRGLATTELQHVFELALSDGTASQQSEKLVAQATAALSPIDVLSSCIESLYKDRLEPTLGRVQKRLRQRGWSNLEAQSAIFLAASQQKIFKIEDPADGRPMLILLKRLPSSAASFERPQVEKVADELNFIVLQNYLRRCNFKASTLAEAAEILVQLALPEPLCRMRQGELREVLRCLMDRKLLVFDEDVITLGDLPVGSSEASEALDSTSRRIYSRI